MKCFNNGKCIEFYMLSSIKELHFLTQLNKICMEKLILPSSLPCQGIPEFYGTWKFISVHKTLSLGPIVSQTNPVHTLPYCLFNISFNILEICRSTKWYFPLFPLQNSVALYKFHKYLMCESGKYVINAHYLGNFLYCCSLYIAYIEGNEIYCYVGE